MQTVVINVPEISTEDRRALEHVLGGPLQDDEQVVISVAPRAEQSDNYTQSGLPAWMHVYQGLSDGEVAELEAAILQRDRTSRVFEEGMDAALLDTDMLSEVFKGRDLHVLHHAASYLKDHSKLTFSVFTWYEVVRGLRRVGATRQLRKFDAFQRNSDVLDISATILDRAAELWSFGEQHGRKPADSDLIIAATAIEAGRVLVTGNTSDFDWMPGLKLENWRTP